MPEQPFQGVQSDHWGSPLLADGHSLRLHACDSFGSPSQRYLPSSRFWENNFNKIQLKINLFMITLQDRDRSMTPVEPQVVVQADHNDHCPHSPRSELLIEVGSVTELSAHFSKLCGHASVVSLGTSMEFSHDTSCKNDWVP